MSDDVKYRIKHNSGSITTPLLVVFIVLKLTGNIGWSWWWVLSPIWISFIIALVLAFVMITTDNDIRR